MFEVERCERWVLKYKYHSLHWQIFLQTCWQIIFSQIILSYQHAAGTCCWTRLRLSWKAECCAQSRAHAQSCARIWPCSAHFSPRYPSSESPVIRERERRELVSMCVLHESKYNCLMSQSWYFSVLYHCCILFFHFYINIFRMILIIFFEGNFFTENSKWRSSS